MVILVSELLWIEVGADSSMDCDEIRCVIRFEAGGQLGLQFEVADEVR